MPHGAEWAELKVSIDLVVFFSSSSLYRLSFKCTQQFIKWWKFVINLNPISSEWTTCKQKHHLFQQHLIYHWCNFTWPNEHALHISLFFFNIAKEIKEREKKMKAAGAYSSLCIFLFFSWKLMINTSNRTQTGTRAW